MQKWTVVERGGESKLKLYELDARNSAKQKLYDFVDAVDGKLNHVLCGAGLPEFVWAIPMGKPVRDDEGYVKNSLGSFIHTSYSKFMEWVEADQEKDLVSVSDLPASLAKKAFEEG